MSIDIHNPHDRFVRQAFTRPEVATPFFERYLPTGIAAGLDLGALSLENDTFVDEELQLQQSDLLFTVRRRDGRPTHLYLLLEHKSQNDIWTPAQLYGYLDRIWARERQPRGFRPPLTPVIPLVLFHGETGWSAVGNFQELVDPPGDLARFTPSFEYILCDLTRDQLDGLQERAWLAMVLQVLKFSRSDELSARLPEIVDLLHQLADRWDDALAFLAMLLRYLAAVSRTLDEATVRSVLSRALPSNTGEKIMATMAEVWMEKGMAKAMEKALESERELLFRQARRRFGEGCALDLGHMIQAVSDSALLAEIGEALVSHDDGDSFLEDVVRLLD